MWRPLQRLRDRMNLYGYIGFLADDANWLVPEPGARWRRSTEGLPVIRRDVLSEGDEARGLRPPPSPLVVTFYSLGDSKRRGEEGKIVALIVFSLLQGAKTPQGNDIVTEVQLVRAIGPLPRDQDVWDSTVINVLQHLLTQRTDWYRFFWADADLKNSFYNSGLVEDYAVAMAVYFKMT